MPSTLLLELWDRVCAASTDRTGRRNEAQAKARFHQLVAQIADRGEPSRPEVGKFTRVGVELHGESLAGRSADEPPLAPGRQTRVAAEARRRNADDDRDPGWRTERAATAGPRARDGRTTSTAMPAGRSIGLDAFRAHGLGRFGDDLLRQRPIAEAMEQVFGIAATSVELLLGATDAGLRGAALRGNVHIRDAFLDMSRPEDVRLLGHELAHVIQQRRGADITGVLIDGDRARLESEAERAADAFTRGEPFAVMGRAPAAVPLYDQPVRARKALRLVLWSNRNLMQYQLDDGSSLTVPLYYNGRPKPGNYKLDLNTLQFSPDPGTTKGPDGKDIVWYQPPDVRWSSSTVDVEVHDTSEPTRIQVDPQLAEATIGTKLKFYVWQPPGYYAPGDSHRYKWTVYNDPETAPKYGGKLVLDYGTDASFEVAPVFPGRHVITCEVQFVPASGPAGPVQKLEYLQVVRAEGEILDEAHRNAKAPDYASFRAGLELQNFNMMQGGLQDQSAAGVPFIQCSGSNPAVPDLMNGPAHNTYTVVPPPGAKTYRWYVRCADISKMQTQGEFGYQRITVDGQPAFEMHGTGDTATWVIAIRNVYTIVCEIFDDAGAKIGTARYRQVVESQADADSRARWQGYMNNVAAGIDKIWDGKEVGLQAAYVNRETGQTVPMVLFAGPSKADPGKVMLVDLLPGVDRIEYEGTTLEDAIAAFENGNSYPVGSIKLTVPKNDSSLPEITKTITTKGQSTWSLWSGRIGWASMGLLVAGIVAGVIPGGQPVAAVCFIAAAATGVASSSLSLYDRLHKAEISATGVALDVLGIATSMIGGASAIRALKLGTAFTFAGATGRFLLYTGFVTGALQGLIISVEGVEQIVHIIDDPKLSRSDKIGAIVRVLGTLILQAALFALSVKDLNQVRAKVGAILGEELVKSLPTEVLHGINMLDEKALRALVGITAEELAQVAKLAKLDPTLASRLAVVQGKELAGHAIESVSGRFSFDGQIQIHPSKLAAMSDQELRELLQVSKALKAVNGDLGQLQAAEKALLEKLTKSAGQRLRFEPQLRQGEQYVDGLGGNRDPRGQILFSTMSAAERERLFDLANAAPRSASGNLEKQACGWALGRGPKTVHEFVELFEMYVARFDGELASRIETYKKAVAAEVATRKAATPGASEAALTKQVQKEMSVAQFEREIDGFGKQFDKAMTEKLEAEWGVVGDPTRPGPGAAQVNAAYDAGAAAMRSHVGSTSIGSGLTNEEAVAKIKAAGEIKFDSEPAAVYHVEKHGKEPPPSERAGAAATADEFLASAQKTIQNPTTVTPKVTQGGARQWHFLREINEGGKVYKMLAIVNLTEDGKTYLATYMNVGKK